MRLSSFTVSPGTLIGNKRNLYKRSLSRLKARGFRDDAATGATIVALTMVHEDLTTE